MLYSASWYEKSRLLAIREFLIYCELNVQHFVIALSRILFSITAKDKEIFTVR